MLTTYNANNLKNTAKQTVRFYLACGTCAPELLIGAELKNGGSMVDTFGVANFTTMRPEGALAFAKALKEAGHSVSLTRDLVACESRGYGKKAQKNPFYNHK